MKTGDKQQNSSTKNALVVEGGAMRGIFSAGVLDTFITERFDPFDLLIGVGIAIKKTARLALWAAIAVSLGYLLLGGVLLPKLWTDPLGPLVKIVPVLLASFAALTILDDR